MKRILIIEDDQTISKELQQLLNTAGYNASILKEFSNAKEEILKSNADLLLMDINIPVMNGELLLKELRKETDVPIIMVTSRNMESDEVLSMSYGADDYITKPYNPNILLLRIGAILKRVKESSDIISYKELSINTKKGIIKKEEKEVVLTKNEIIILNYLLMNQNRIVKRDELMTDLWNNNEYINDNALTVNISRLRAKLNELGYNDAIETRKGIGYLLK